MSIIFFLYLCFTPGFGFSILIKKYYSVLEGYAGMAVAAYNLLKSGV